MGNEASRSKEVDTYIATQPPETQRALEELPREVQQPAAVNEGNGSVP